MKEEKPREEKKKEQKPIEKTISKPKVFEGRGIVRIIDVDVDGSRKITRALLKIKGVGQSLARAIPIAAGIDATLRIGMLTDEQIKKLEDVIRNLSKYNIPYHMLNRRKDTLTGENKHLISSDLTFSKKTDIDLLKKIQAYRGVRHQLGLPVRGQRTRSSFRGGTTMGVIKKKEEPGKAAPPAAAKAAPAAAPAAKPKPEKK